MKIKSIFVISILIISNAIVLFAVPIPADDGQPQWPNSWIPIDTDPIENYEKLFRDISSTYYFINSNYLFFRLECYGHPNFTAHPEDSRYKWFIDVDGLHNMVWSGGKVVEADYLLFVEDTDNDGNGDVYLLNDINGNGDFDEWEPPNDYLDGLITDSNIANYSISDKNLTMWVKLESISDPDHAYFTWSTDTQNSNINQAPTCDRSDVFSADLSKADLSIVKYGNKDPVSPGDILTYTLSITNLGPHNAENINISDVLPSQVNFISSNPSYSSHYGSTYIWNVPYISTGETKVITVTVRVKNGFTGTITNNAHVQSATRDLVLGNNDCTQTTSYVKMADLQIFKSAKVETVYPGDYFDYTINVTNNGPDKALNVNIYDMLPSQVVFNFASPSYIESGGSVYRWNYAVINAGESKLITINVTVKQDAVGPIINTANVTSDTYDPNPGNESNNDDEQTNIFHKVDLSILKTCNVNKTNKGNTIVYTLNITNHGPDSAINVNITDTLPAGVTYSSSDFTLSGSIGQTYWWSVPVLNKNESKEIRISVKVNNNASNKIINTAVVSSDGKDLNLENNECALETMVEIGTSGGGGSSSGWSGEINLLPTADPGGPYFGFIGEEIEFIGSSSKDNDEGGESIIQYDWKFFDTDIWHLDLGAAPKYIYYDAGVFNVTLSVLDDEGSSSFGTTTVTIAQANLPPTNIIISGEIKGHQNISYYYNISASDPDGDNITYNVNWDDGISEVGEPIPSGSIYTADHKWLAPGEYIITVNAADEKGAQSGGKTLVLLIDILYAKDIGYLIDYNSDGTYDKFYSNKTKQETTAEKLDDGRYLINDDEDDFWEWIYNPNTDNLDVYYSGENADLTLWYLVIILILLSLIFLLLLIYKGIKKKEAPSETTAGQP